MQRQQQNSGAWYKNKQNIALMTGFVSTAITILNLLISLK